MAQKTSGKSGKLYDFSDYRAFLKSWIEMATRKRGQLSRLSEAANIHKTTLSQILHGVKDLSLEQAHRIAHHIGLNDEEMEYFLLLVNFARAGSSDLKETFRKQIENRQKLRLQLSQRVTRSRDLNTEERAIYYSNWIYSAVRNLTAIPHLRHPQEIAKTLGVEVRHVHQILDFLLKTGLCRHDANGFSPGPQMTHIEAGSPLVSRHHGNWRVKAMERHPLLDQERELAYTAPMTLSSSDVRKVRALLADLVEETDKIVEPSPSEKLYCMCLDWFEVK